MALLAVGDPDLYLRHLDAVAHVAERLRHYADIEELGDAYGQWRTIVSPVAKGEADALDQESVAGTAWMVRWRELTDARHKEQVAVRISEARRRGDSWVTVSESGPPPTSALSYPCERTMMRLIDGLAVRAAVEIDPDTYGPLYTVRIIRLDPLSGLEVSLAGSEPPPRQFADRTVWQERIAALLAELDVSTTNVRPADQP
jgi:hypothetical protein